MWKKLRQARRRVERHGVARTAYAYALKSINAIFFLRILRGVSVDAPDAAFLKSAEGHAAGFLAGPPLREFARDPSTELSDTFLDDALARGDECYAIRDGATLAAYGWYSFGGTPIGLGDLTLSFDPRYVYMYKGFTDPRYRGQRLHAIGMTQALQHYRQSGYSGLVSYVEADNFDSLKSCFRMGYAVFGSIYVVRLLGRYLAFSSPGCARFEFRLGHAEPEAAPLGFGKR